MMIIQADLESVILLQMTTLVILVRRSLFQLRVRTFRSLFFLLGTAQASNWLD